MTASPRGCGAAKGTVDALACVDRLLLEDRAPDLVNLVSLEYLARKAYAIETGFELARQESDWKRPSGKKEWTSKVDWDMIHRIDPASASDAARGEYAREVREELKTGMARDVDFAKLKMNFGERSTTVDPING